MALRCKTVRYCLGNMVIGSQAVGKCWVAITGGTVFTNETTDINSSTASDVPLGGAVNDAIYIGCSTPFGSITCDMGTAIAGGVGVVEYWDGSAWQNITASDTLWADNDNPNWTVPADWAPTQVNSEVDGPWYYIRLRVTTVRTTAGSVNAIAVGNLLQVANARTINIPETTSRTIRHACLRIMPLSSNTELQDYFQVRYRWDSTAYANPVSTWNTANSWTAPAESWSMIQIIDITSSMATAWASGTSHDIDVQVGWHGRGAAFGGNHYMAWAELYVTYEFDDVDTTQLNTIVIPFDADLDDMTATLSTVGGANAWPILTGGSGLIKEASPVIRDLYIVWMGNAREAGTTDWSLAAALDAEGEVTLATFDASKDSDYYFEAPWRRTDADPTTVHDIKARVTSITGATIAHLGGVIVCTYEYDESATTVRTHTATIPVMVDSGFAKGTASTDKQVKTITYDVQGENAALLQSGAQVFRFQNADPGTLRLAFGGQTARAYTVGADNTSGPISVTQRFDSGGVAGSGITFARGKINLDISAYDDTTLSSAAGIAGVVYLTFSYDKTAGKRHSSAYFFISEVTNYATTSSVTSSLQALIPEASYRITAASQMIITHSASSGTFDQQQLWRGSDLGWYHCPAQMSVIDGNFGPRISCNDILQFLVAYPGQPNVSSLVDVVGSSKATRLNMFTSSRGHSAFAVFNWHDYTYTVSGNITDSAGGTVTINLHDNTTGTELANTSRSGNGSYSFTWYDNTALVHADAYEDSTHLGRSDAGYAA